MKKFLLAIGLFFLSIINGLACSCAYPVRNFYESISSSEQQGLFVLDSISITYHESSNFELPTETGHFILIDKINPFDAEISDTVIVLGQDGFNCNKFITDFEVGDTLILSLFKVEEDTFSLEGCNTHFLEIEEGMNNNKSYEEIKENISDIITSVIHLDNANSSVEVFPNPFQTEIVIEPDIFEISSLEFLNHKGELVEEVQYSFPREDVIQLNTEHFSSGHYFLRIKDRDGQRNRIIKLFKE